MSYKSFDGQMISAFLWMPYNLKRDGSNPASFCLTVVRPDRQSRASAPRQQRSPLADTFASLPTCVDRLATASHSRRRITRTWAAAICRMRFTRRNSSSTPLCRCQEDRHHRRLVRRLHDADGDRRTPDIWAAAVSSTASSTGTPCCSTKTRCCSSTRRRCWAIRRKTAPSTKQAAHQVHPR